MHTNGHQLYDKPFSGIHFGNSRVSQPTCMYTPRRSAVLNYLFQMGCNVDGVFHVDVLELSMNKYMLYLCTTRLYQIIPVATAVVAKTDITKVIDSRLYSDYSHLVIRDVIEHLKFILQNSCIRFLQVCAGRTQTKSLRLTNFTRQHWNHWQQHTTRQAEM